jgi:hypothetical protein
MHLHDHTHTIAINTKYCTPGPTKLKVGLGNEARTPPTNNRGRIALVLMQYQACTQLMPVMIAFKLSLDAPKSLCTT